MTSQVSVYVFEVLSEEPLWSATLTVPDIYGGGVVTGTGSTAAESVNSAWETYQRYLLSDRAKEASLNYGRVPHW